MILTHEDPMLPFLLLACTPVEPDKYSDETEDTAMQSTDTSTFDDDTADTEELCGRNELPTEDVVDRRE